MSITSVKSTCYLTFFIIIMFGPSILDYISMWFFFSFSPSVSRLFVVMMICLREKILERGGGSMSLECWQMLELCLRMNLELSLTKTMIWMKMLNPQKMICTNKWSKNEQPNSLPKLRFTQGWFTCSLFLNITIKPCSCTCTG